MLSMSEMRDIGGVPDWTLGWRLRRALEHGDVSVQEMADYLGYSRSNLSRFLNDHGTAPRRSVVMQWALKCKVDYHWLSTGEVGPDGGSDLGVSPTRRFNATGATIHLLHARVA